MVASVILSLVATSLVAAFIQNARMARAVMLRTAATTTAIGIAEQLRSYSYTDLMERRDAPSTAAFPVRVFNPTNTTADAGMTSVDLKLNVVDGTPVEDTAPTGVNVPVVLNDAGTQTRVDLPMRFWLRIQNRVPQSKEEEETDPNTGKATKKTVIIDRCEVFEIALVYQWRNPLDPNGKWQSSVLRVVTPNSDMNSAGGASS